MPVYIERERNLDTDLVVAPNHAVVYVAEDEIVEADAAAIGGWPGPTRRQKSDAVSSLASGVARDWHAAKQAWQRPLWAGWLPLIIDAVATRSPPVDQRLQTSIAYNRLTVLLTSTPLVHEESAKLRNQISFHYRVPILHVR